MHLRTREWNNATRFAEDAEMNTDQLKFQSRRRTLRNYYAPIHMGLNNPDDIDIAKAALDRLIRENESEILSEEIHEYNRTAKD